MHTSNDHIRVVVVGTSLLRYEGGSMTIYGMVHKSETNTVSKPKY